MIEQIFKLTQGNEKTVEKVIIDENIHYMHMILNKGECLPEHFSNAKNVYITVVRGTLSATLNEQETHEYQAGTVLKVPFHTKMNLKNVSEETLEFIVVKAPAPNCYIPICRGVLLERICHGSPWLFSLASAGQFLRFAGFSTSNHVLVGG